MQILDVLISPPSLFVLGLAPLLYLLWAEGLIKIGGKYSDKPWPNNSTIDSIFFVILSFYCIFAVALHASYFYLRNNGFPPSPETLKIASDFSVGFGVIRGMEAAILVLIFSVLFYLWIEKIWGLSMKREVSNKYEWGVLLSFFLVIFGLPYLIEYKSNCEAFVTLDHKFQIILFGQADNLVIGLSEDERVPYRVPAFGDWYFTNAPINTTNYFFNFPSCQGKFVPLNKTSPQNQVISFSNLYQHVWLTFLLPQIALTWVILKLIGEVVSVLKLPSDIRELLEGKKKE